LEPQSHCGLGIASDMLNYMSSVSVKRCELIAPAGNWDSARAAVENGADAIYFGLQNGINARARATNFLITELPDLMFYLHERGVKGYLTLNTLVFANELADAERIALQAIRSGVDTFIVQDVGLLRLLHCLCPKFPIQASTQMTLSSAECIRAVEPYGVKRVVLPRELSLAQIAAVHRETSVELEVFVHGALCISYSGQCTASLALGGRSGNRGQCAQACRMAYELISARKGDSPIFVGTKIGTVPPHTPCAEKGTQSVPTTLKRYWLSPHDLALWDRLPELLAAGVSALKIEGRMKEPEYVALATRCYRQALDAALLGKPFALEADRVEELEVAFSRGFSSGWLDGPHPHALVSGKNTAKRGVPIGTVTAVSGDRILVRLTRSVRRGQGVVFEDLHDQDSEQGGRIYEIFLNRQSVEHADASSEVALAFGRNDLDLRQIQPGQNIYCTDDPRLTKELRKSFNTSVPQRRVSLDIVVRAAVGEKLHIEALAASGAHCNIDSEEPLAEAIKHPLDCELLREQFGRLGRTPYELRHLNTRIEGRPMTPLSVLGKMRKAMVAALDDSLRQPPDYSLPAEPLLPQLRSRVVACNHVLQPCQEKSWDVVASNHPTKKQKSFLHVLCRSVEQVKAATALDVNSIYADFQNVEEYTRIISLAQSAGKKIFLATTRIHQSESAASLEYLEKLRPDGILARHLGAIEYFHCTGLPVIADYSLNAANDMAVETLLQHGANRVTAAFDLNQKTCADMLTASVSMAPVLEVILHGHVPMFHTAYCLYCAAFSDQDAKPQCGQPCLTRKSRLRDRKGCEHPVLVDADCHNTVFHAQPQSLAEYWTWLTGMGVQHFRIELLDHTADETADLIAVYRDLLDNLGDGKEALRRLGAVQHANVTCGTWRFDK
jgi:U32 family peptidase